MQDCHDSKVSVVYTNTYTPTSKYYTNTVTFHASLYHKMKWLNKMVKMKMYLNYINLTFNLIQIKLHLKLNSMG